MSSPGDVLDRIDSLMRRKRVFVAQAPVQTSVDHAADLDDEDIPILTEVVDIAEVTGDTPNIAAHRPLDPLLDALTQEFSLQLQERFAAQLPDLIEQASKQLAIALQQSVHRITEETLHDFTARRRQLPLALDEEDG